MKVLAFFIAALFVFQAALPGLCLSNCIPESAAGSSCSLIAETGDCCMKAEATCVFAEEKSCCAAEEMTACSISEEDGIESAEKNALPCNDCSIPCCSAPLCCFYFQEITDIDLSIRPVTLTGILPSNNGSPVSGFCDECFQPPEIV